MFMILPYLTSPNFAEQKMHANPDSHEALLRSVDHDWLSWFQSSLGLLQTLWKEKKDTVLNQLIQGCTLGQALPRVLWSVINKLG